VILNSCTVILVAITCFLISALASDDGRRYCPMRLRIQTFGPLPELKAWFVPEIKTAQETVFDLKGLLCKGVQPLRNGRFQAKDLILILEEFELLNDSPLTAVRDGDLIFVKVSPLATNEDQMDTEPGASFISGVGSSLCLLFVQFVIQKKGRELRVKLVEKF